MLAGLPRTKHYTLNTAAAAASHEQVVTFAFVLKLRFASLFSRLCYALSFW